MKLGYEASLLTKLPKHTLNEMLINDQMVSLLSRRENHSAKRKEMFFFQYRDKNKSFRHSAKGNHLSTTAVSYFSRQKVVTLTGFCVPDIHIPNCSELKVCIYVASFQRSQ